MAYWASDVAGILWRAPEAHRHPGWAEAGARGVPVAGGGGVAGAGALSV